MKDTELASRPLLIVGAGVAGLACALALAKAGCRSLVCERAPSLQPVGAGLQLSANALSVLDQLGLKAALAERGFSASSVALRDGASDRLLALVPVESGQDGYIAVHRADLQSVLLDAAMADPSVEVRLGLSFQRVESQANGLSVWFLGADGSQTTVETSLLIGADGVHSPVAAFAGCKPPVDSRLVAHRFSIADAPGPEIEAWLAPSSHAVSYPMRKSGERNLVVVEPVGVPHGAPDSRDWNPRLSDFLTRGDYLGAWPLLTVDADDRLRSRERIVLIGDAAHAMFPFAAQGAAMALEDAWVLASCLATKATIQEGLAAYAATRLPRIQRVLKRVSFHRRVYHLGWPLSLARNLAMRVRPEAAMRADLSWLYDWRAEPIAPPL
ncbi:FAD-dependent monooxygenase [Aureimonas ureilytica]|nr:FAD-dependent monooxygenase [Aureimonas ureilytica]